MRFCSAAAARPRANVTELEQQHGPNWVFLSHFFWRDRNTRHRATAAPRPPAPQNNSQLAQLGRLETGNGTGRASPCGTIHCSSVSPTERRGRVAQPCCCSCTCLYSHGKSNINSDYPRDKSLHLPAPLPWASSLPSLSKYWISKQKLQRNHRNWPQITGNRLLLELLFPNMSQQLD